jgi:hypothetical protein
MAETISLARRQFLPAIIRDAVWLYFRFTLSYRDVEDLLAERGRNVSASYRRPPEDFFAAENSVRKQRGTLF